MASDDGRLKSPEQERHEFESSVILKKELTTRATTDYKSEVRSVFGWTDSTQEVPATPVCHAMGEHQSSMPRLPVPKLEHTSRRFLKTLEPLLTADEFDHAELEMNSFLEKEGPVLQKALEERQANSDEHTSWLEEWWDDSYLCARDSIAINVNYFFGFEDDPKAEKMHQIGRAASLLHGAMSFYDRYNQSTLDMDFEREKPLCMSQMRRVFNASRIPEVHRDIIRTHLGRHRLSEIEKIAKTAQYKEGNEARHVAVLVGSKLFSFPVFVPAEDDAAAEPRLLSIAEMEVMLAHVLRVHAEVGSAIPVEVATTLNRDRWANLRQQLIVHAEKNRETLEMIETALMVLVLEDMAPEHDEELSRLLLHGPGVNRWFDRHNLVVCKNGKAGLNFEHAIGDGATTLRVADSMYTHSVAHGRDAATVDANVAESCDLTQPAPVPPQIHGWVLNAQIEQSLKEGYGEFKDAILQTESTVLHFEQFGGLFVKQVAAMSPDAFVQVALQVAYHKYYGRNDATYEAASTRSYFHGRTEVVRAATPEVSSFCKSLDTTCLTDRVAGQKLPTQLRLLRAAVGAHVEYMREAKVANGVDRHLLGLRMIYEENPEAFGFELPDLFKGRGYRKSSHWNLSTSHCGSSSLRLFGFGPVVADGFGVGYMIKNDSVSFNITAKYSDRSTSCTVLASLLEEALLHLRAIVLADPERIKKSAPKSLDFTHPTSHTDDQLATWMRTGVLRRSSFRN
eukprot:Rhum_TRINITY_DN25180_c0_g1::Rhum_TRINITY_DN25180_c0_g1_i1::g.181418::m.181418/K00624/E2.3.1.7; carnitine O-acetyltransferase